MPFETSDVVRLHDESLLRWYGGQLPRDGTLDPAPCDALGDVVVAQHFCNFTLWNLEDEARRRDVDDAYIAAIKRSIDRWNQKRNDFIEQLDERLIALLGDSNGSAAERHSETAGSMVDRLSILALKVWHMSRHAARDDDRELAAECRSKLSVLERQRSDLHECLVRLLDDCRAGRRFFTVYRQFKSYNDERLNPALAATSSTPRAARRRRTP